VVNTYAGYIQCERCGVYDNNPNWCVLCGKRKNIDRSTNSPVGRDSRRTSALSRNVSSANLDQRRAAPQLKGR